MKLLAFTFALSFFLFFGKHSAFSWGSTGHKFINKKSVVHLPMGMQQFINQASFFELHAMDADGRKGSDTSESPKHFIDIDWYPNFQNLTHNLDSLLLQYGWQVVVRDNGINPWATSWTLDSLTKQLQRGDWNKAYLTASDLGHYVGDGHQPLHNTKNYNGQYTGNNGIHSRYESTMLNNVQNELLVLPDSVFYIEQPLDFIFSYIYHSNALVDSVLHADDSAKAISGGAYNDAYYQELWNRTKILTLDQIQNASEILASLFYTAWVNSGLLPPLSVSDDESIVQDFSLLQNYPNPFNPMTNLSFVIRHSSLVVLKIYNVIGNEVAVLIDGEQMNAGKHIVQFDTRFLSSGMYFARMQTGDKVFVRRIMLVQ